MHRALAVGARHLLCYYVLSGRYSHGDEATYANWAPNSGAEEWLENRSRTAGKHRLRAIKAPRGARSSSPGGGRGVAGQSFQALLCSVFVVFSVNSASFRCWGCSWQGVRQRRQIINCLITRADMAYFFFFFFCHGPTMLVINWLHLSTE